MATATLTPRQQEIKSLLDAGKTPVEIAKKLKITDNAVYQQLRRMREAGKGGKAVAKRTPARKSAAKPVKKATTAAKPIKPSRSRPRSTTRATSGNTATGTAKNVTVPSPAVAMTPLESVRARREAIAAELAEVRQAHEAAVKVADEAKATRETAEGAYADELNQLDAAEAALSPKPVAKNGSGSKKGAKAALAAVPAPTEATVEPPAGADEPPAPESEPTAAVAVETEQREPVDDGGGDDGLVGDEPPSFSQSGEDAFGE